MIRHLGMNLARAIVESGAQAVTYGAEGTEFVTMSVAEARGMADERNALPVLIQLPPTRAEPGERWASFRERQADALGGLAAALEGSIGLVEATPSFTACTLKAHLAREQIEELDRLDIEVFSADLDDVVQVVHLDDVHRVVGASEGDGPRPLDVDLTGEGVSVAVVDSGADLGHPELRIDPADSISTCPESDAIPGRHGTHVAGCVASRDASVRGIAPDVRLINIKALRANGAGERDAVTRGVDAALGLGADIISMSLGWNHLPRWSPRGHGYQCPDAACPLCLSVANAVAMGALVVVAAGNDHQRAEALRAGGWGASYDTELSCPGQATDALTVGAITKTLPFGPAAFSSSGSSADGRVKPDLAAPGVNITSTFPMPRNPDGSIDATAPRSVRFGQLSGTSMATPIVAGAAALLVEHMRTQSDTRPKPGEVRDALLAEWVEGIGGPRDVVGRGRLAVG